MNITTGRKIWLTQANSIIPNNKPIVFWDTCALLDAVRTPLKDREKLTINTLLEYEQMERWISNGSLVSVTSELVVTEFGAHVDEIINLLLQQEQKTKDCVKEQTGFMSDMSKAASIASRIDMLDVRKRVVAVVKKIWRKTIILKGQQSFMQNADYRVRNYIKPSSPRGKESYKDCYLWTSYISLMKQVVPTQPSFFFTTNPADFAESRKSIKLHPDLAAELPFANVECALNMDILQGKLTGYFNAHP